MIDAVVRAIARHCYRRGIFTLQSGATSSEYVDLKRVLLHPRRRRRLGAVLTDLVWRLCRDNKPAAFAGVPRGGDPLACSLADWFCWSTADDDAVPVNLMIRDADKRHGQSGRVAGAELVHIDGPVVLVEDVATTGESSLKAAAAVQAELPGRDVVCLAVVDRRAGAEQRLADAGIRFAAFCTLDDVRSAHDHNETTHALGSTREK